MVDASSCGTSVNPPAVSELGSVGSSTYPIHSAELDTASPASQVLVEHPRYNVLFELTCDVVIEV